MIYFKKLKKVISDEEFIEFTEINPQKVLNNEDIISMCFTMTKDLDAVYPAVAVREILDIHDIPMLNYEEKHIQGSLSKCIRVMMYINTEKTKADIKHIYLNNAKNLRKDLINK